MSFLGKGIKPVGKLGVEKPKPVIAAGIKPVVGIKPGIKPTIKPAVQVQEKKEEEVKVEAVTEKAPTTINPVPSSTPTMKLPTIKAPSIQPIKAEIAEAKENEGAEIKPNMQPVDEPVAVEEVKEESTVETSVETPAEIQEEVVEETKEESAQETIKEVDPKREAIEEVKREELVYGEFTLEEWNAMSPQKRAAVTRKKNQEEKAAKIEKKAESTPAKTTANTASGKQTAFTDFAPTLLPKRSEVDYEELIANLVITSLGEEWDKMVEQVRVQLKSIQITPDMNAGTMKQATADLASLRDEIFYEATQAKTTFEGVTAKIDVVKGLNTKGSSPDERRLNGLKACVHYSENGYDINLYELLEVARVKHNFYSEIMKQIEYKKNALITMNGALKLEKDLGIN